MAQGKFYWGLKVPEHVSPNKEMFLHADLVNIVQNTLIFMNQADKGAMQVVLSLSEGNWHAVYAASVIDGRPLACEHWKGTLTEP